MELLATCAYPLRVAGDRYTLIRMQLRAGLARCRGRGVEMDARREALYADADAAADRWLAAAAAAATTIQRAYRASRR